MPAQESEGPATNATNPADRTDAWNTSSVAPGLVAALMLLGALGSWPYGYFTLLRWVTATSAVLFAFDGYRTRNAWMTWTFAFIAILFNPLVPVYLTREIWLPIDVAVAMVFAFAIACQIRRCIGKPDGLNGM